MARERLTLSQMAALAEVERYGSIQNAIASRMAALDDGRADAERRRSQEVAFRALIRRLEQLLGSTNEVMVLVDRRTGELSEEGRRIVGHGRRILHSIEALELEAADIRQSQRPLRASCYPSQAGILTQAMQQWEESHGGRAELRGVDDVSRLGSGNDLREQLHLCLLHLVVLPYDLSSERMPFKPPFRSEPLYRWTLRAVMGVDHPLRRSRTRRQIEWDDLRRFPLMASPRGHRSREKLQALLGDEEIDPVTVSRSADALFVLAMQSDERIALMPDDALPLRDIEGHLLQSWPVVRVNGQAVTGEFQVAWNADAGPEVQSLVDSIGEEARRRGLKKLSAHTPPS